METGTAFFAVAIIGFMLMSRGFRYIVFAIAAVVFVVFVFVEHQDATRREQAAAAYQVKRCQNFFAGPEDGCKQ